MGWQPTELWGSDPALRLTAVDPLSWVRPRRGVWRVLPALSTLTIPLDKGIGRT